jgi:cytochrome c oxidase subunit 3
MIRELSLLTPAERQNLSHSVLVRERLEEQYENLEQQSQAAAFGMWLFLATEVMFFGPLFLSLGVYRFLFPKAVETASTELVWQVAAVNTIVLLVSSLTMNLAVHFVRLDRRRAAVWLLVCTALLGAVFLGLKACEYYLDYRDYLIPGWRFQEHTWIQQHGLSAKQVGNVKIFLFLYWFMTAMHGLHLTIGIGVVSTMAVLAYRGAFDRQYYSPVEVTGLYWHFVDLVWIFLVPMLYLQGTHSWHTSV